MARANPLVTQALQQQITRLAREKRLDRLAPLLTFQSIIDFTVSTRAIILEPVCRNSPSNGSELVLFDLNRSAKFGQLLRTALGDGVDASSTGAPPAVQDNDHRQCKPRQR